MAFTWLPVSQNKTKAKASHANELKSNTDTLMVNLALTGASAFNWTQLPVSARKVEITKMQIEELRGALDYTDDYNLCRAELSSNNDTDQSANQTGDDTSDYITDNAAENTGDDVALRSGEQSAQEASQLTANETGEQAECASQRTSHNQNLSNNSPN
jgi:hypothetical protein